MIWFQGQTKELDTSKLNTLRKHVRPLDEQLDNESRKLWQNVTESLKAQDIENATHHKRFVSYLLFGLYEPWIELPATVPCVSVLILY